MHDIRTIRDNPDAFDAGMARRGLSGLSSQILAIDTARREKITAAETAQAERNAASKQVGAAKGRGDEAEFERLRALVAAKKDEIARLNDEARAEDARLSELLMGLPNIPDPATPDGADEADNVELRRWGTPREMSFAALEHYQIPAAQKGLDFETAAKLAGLEWEDFARVVPQRVQQKATFGMALTIHNPAAESRLNALQRPWGAARLRSRERPRRGIRRASVR